MVTTQRSERGLHDADVLATLQIQECLSNGTVGENESSEAQGLELK